MHFTRFFNNGEANRKRFAKFKCDLCNQEFSLDANKDNYDTSPKPCPDCKAVDSNDLRKHHTVKRDQLIQQINVLQAEVDRLNAELAITEPQRRLTDEIS